jgi:uncharacterized Zn finger protein
MPSNISEIDQFKELTWEDIENWAGSKVLSRGRKYQKGRLVNRLARTPGGGLIADVAGSEAYTTFVAFQDKSIVSHCTCPYRESCKHAVAVILEYLEQVKKGVKIPTVNSGDLRFARMTTSLVMKGGMMEMMRTKRKILRNLAQRQTDTAIPRHNT